MMREQCTDWCTAVHQTGSRTGCTEKRQLQLIHRHISPSAIIEQIEYHVRQWTQLILTVLHIVISSHTTVNRWIFVRSS